MKLFLSVFVVVEVMIMSRMILLPMTAVAFVWDPRHVHGHLPRPSPALPPSLFSGRSMSGHFHCHDDKRNKNLLVLEFYKPFHDHDYYDPHNNNIDPMDRADAAQPLPLSIQDLERLAELQHRASMTIPIVIMDALLPGQKLYFQSPDPKFEEMINHVLSKNAESNEVGIIGLNPHTGHPMNIGVTAPVKKKDITYGITRNSERILATYFHGTRRFEVIGEPWMDPTQSFYLAEVEIVDNRQEPMTTSQEQVANRLYESIPQMIHEWTTLVIEKEKLTPAGITKILKDIGPMPIQPKERAIWVCALLNPIGLMVSSSTNSSSSSSSSSSKSKSKSKSSSQSQSQLGTPKQYDLLGLNQEIRPAMLSCRNNHDRLVLAAAALQASMNNLRQE